MRIAATLTPEEFKRQREELNLSRAALGALMGVDYLSVRRWEQPGVKISRITELAFIAVKHQLEENRKGAEMAKTVDEAIEYARKHDMKVEEHDLGILVVSYPSGESRTLNRDDPDASRIINDMTANLL